MRLTTPLIFALAALTLALPALGAPKSLTMDPDATQITFLLEATGSDVQGKLFLREGLLELDPATGTASGTLTIDATRTESGHAKRDKTMHAKVLESDAHPLIVFSPKTFSGTIPDRGASEIEVEGTVVIDGGEHPLTLRATVEVDGDRFSATTSFPVPFVEWGMHDPSVLFLRVAKVVDVTVAATGTISAATESEGP